MARQAAERFVGECVVGFGFVSGLFTGVGVDPETEIVEAFAQLANSIHAGLGWLFWLILPVSWISSVGVAYASGKWLGLMAVALAFLGGMLMVTWSPAAGVVLLLIGIGAGYLATR